MKKIQVMQMSTGRVSNINVSTIKSSHLDIIEEWLVTIAASALLIYFLIKFFTN